MRASVRVAAILVLAALLLPALAAACPLCKEASSDADRPGSTSVWRGMYWSILFMIAMPFAMAGTMILLIRRARKRFEASRPRPPAPLRFPESRGAPL
jgi:hypothetical protein